MDNINKQKTFQIDWVMFGIPAVVMAALVIWGFVDNDGYSAVTLAVKGWVLKYFTSEFMLVAFVLLVTCIVLALSPIGKVKFGGPDAEPEFSVLRWFAMVLCGGIGIGIVFFGVLDPVTFFHTMPAARGVEAGTPEAAVYALSQSFMHWAFIPYAIPTILGIGIAYAVYNRNLPFRVSSLLYPILGDKIYGPLGKVIDVVCIFSCIGANTPGFVFATQQFTAGLHYQYDIPESMVVYCIVIAIITAVFTITSIMGIKKGINTVSNINFWIYIGLLAFIFIAGSGVFILGIGVEAFGDYLGRLIPDSLITDPFQLQDGFVGNNTAFIWCWNFCGAPVVAMFAAKIAKGRTIRQYVMINLGVTGVFAIIWFSIFGGAALYGEYYGTSNIFETMLESGNQVSFFSFLGSFPLSSITVPVTLAAVFFSFVTLANSMVTSMSILTSNISIAESDDAEPPTVTKLAWGLLIGAFAIVILMTGTADNIQTSAVMVGCPISLLYIAAIVATIKNFTSKRFKRELAVYRVREEEELKELDEEELA